MLKPIVYTEHGVELTLFGLITSEEILVANAGIIKHDKFTTWRYQLWIFENVEDIRLSTNDVRNLARQDTLASHENPDLKIAIVSDSTLAFGLGRMYEAYSSDNKWETMVFGGLEEAREWLGPIRG